MFNMWTIIQMHIWNCEKDKSPIEHLYHLGLEHNINNLKRGKICDVKLHIIHHLCVNIHAPPSKYANGLFES
jgi:hypothetical protein